MKYEARKETGAYIVDYVDSNYAGDLDTRRSLIRYIFKVCGNTVSQKVNLQPVVTLLTTEVEYIITTEVVNEAMLLRGLVEELGIKLEHVKVFCDSQSTLQLTEH